MVIVVLLAIVIGIGLVSLAVARRGRRRPIDGPQ
jgi:hypothetical protein